MPPIINHRRVPSFGECIYCRRRPPDIHLTDEHVIPFSLGGNFIITDGSCDDCAKVTSNLEGHLAAHMWKDMRYHIDEQSRRKRGRPTILPAKAIIGGELKSFDLPIKDHPYFFPLPVWGVPGFLTGEKPTETFEYEKAHVFYYLPPNIKDALRLKGGELAEIPFPDFRINVGKFARAIAKIAYCDVVARKGLYSFDPIHLVEIILGRDLHISHFVGVDMSDPSPPGPAEAKHSITIKLHQVEGGTLIISEVRLYANSGTEEHGMPIYQVVVGMLRPDAPEYVFHP